MLLHIANPEHSSDREEGYLLLTVLVLVFLLLLALSVAAPRVAKEIQRDKELETKQRGLQYQRAIKLYYKKFGSYPTDVKQLENTNQIRFLRRRYTDPMTGKDDWRLIHMGEAKVPPMGLFGQPMQKGLSSVSTGLGVGGSIYSPSDTNNTGGQSGNTSGAVGVTSSSDQSSTNGGSSGFGFSNSNSGSNSGSTFGPSSGGIGGSGGTGFGSSNGGFSSNGTGRGDNPGGSTTFGSGGPIVGVGLPLKKDALIEYHKQKKYSQWEFVYDPQQDMLMSGGAGGLTTNGAGAGGNNPAGVGAPSGNGTGTGSFGGSGFGNSGSGSGSGFGFGNSGGTGSTGSSGTSGSFGTGSGSGSSDGGNSGTTSNPPQQQ